MCSVYVHAHTCKHIIDASHFKEKGGWRSHIITYRVISHCCFSGKIVIKETATMVRVAIALHATTQKMRREKEKKERNKYIGLDTVWLLLSCCQSKPDGYQSNSVNVRLKANVYIFSFFLQAFSVKSCKMARISQPYSLKWNRSNLPNFKHTDRMVGSLFFFWNVENCQSHLIHHPNRCTHLNQTQNSNGGGTQTKATKTKNR